MNNGKAVRCEWRRFDALSPSLLYELLRFRQAIFVVEQASPYPDLDDRDQGADHLLLWQNAALAGCLRLIPYPDEKRVVIGRVAIAPALRRKGLARLMMAEALARWAADYPACAVALAAQTYLVRFYETLGFRPISPPYDDCGVPHVEMRRG